MKILIEVRGGVVESVYVSTPEKVEVEILDHDNDETGDGCEPSVEFKPIYNAAHVVA